MPNVRATAQEVPTAYAEAVNFFGHAHVARRVDDDPRWVLGSMLPDFASMCRARMAGVDDPRVEAGVTFHHETDDVFHGCRVFVELQSEGIDALEAAGVGRGPARATAHVGLELLLDGLLLDDGATCTSYLEAVSMPGDWGVRLRRGEARFAALRERVVGYGLPEDYRHPDRVAGRLQRILAPRPRLAFAPGDERPVTRWLEQTRPTLARRLDELLGELDAGLRGVDRAARARAILPGRSREELGI